MHTRKTLISIGIVMAVFAAVLWVGCSNSSVANLGTGQASSSAAIEAFFPMTEGYCTTFQLEYAQGYSEIVRFEAGDLVKVQGRDAVEWFNYGNGASLDTTFYRAEGNALYKYENSWADPEKVLELPFTAGRAWEVLTAVEEYDDTDTTDGGGDTNRQQEDLDGADTTSTPLAGPQMFSLSQYMVVDGLGELEMSDGTYYSRAVRIRTDSRAGTSNYYWFVAGIGLVKYVVGADFGDPSGGTVTGELVEYGYRR